MKKERHHWEEKNWKESVTDGVEMYEIGIVCAKDQGYYSIQQSQSWTSDVEIEKKHTLEWK